MQCQTLLRGFTITRDCDLSLERKSWDRKLWHSFMILAFLAYSTLWYGLESIIPSHRNK
jgi:hypothetical protein